MPDVQFAFLNGISYIGSIIVDDGLESLIFRVMYNFHYLIVFTKIENIFLLQCIRYLCPDGNTWSEIIIYG